MWSSPTSRPTRPRGSEKVDERREVRPRAGPWPGRGVAAPAGDAAVRDGRGPRSGRDQRIGRGDPLLLDDRPPAGCGPAPLEPWADPRIPRRARRDGAALWHGDVARREGKLPWRDPGLAVRQEADAARTVALQRRAIALPGRLPLHQEHRLVPAPQRGATGDHEQAHARWTRVPRSAPAACE